MSGQADGETLADNYQVGSGEPETPEADKFLEEAVKGEAGGKADNPGEQPPESGEKPEGADQKPTEEQTPKTPEGEDGGKKQEEQPEDFEKIETPTSDDWRKAREALKAQKARNKELEAAAKAREERKPEERKPDDAPAAHERRNEVPPDVLFDTLAKVVSGEETKFKRADVERFIQSRLSPAQVKGVIEAARDGKFGEGSQEILALAQEQLPMVIASADENRARNEKAGKILAEREAASRELVEAFPEIAGKDENNPVYKELDTNARELEGLIPNLHNIPGAPRIVKTYTELKRKALVADALTVERDSLKKENERLTKLLGHSAKPPAGGGKTTEKQEKSADEWLEEQAAKGVFRSGE